MPNTAHNNNGAHTLREKLAELEHQQWWKWSKSLADSQSLSADRLEAWRSRWVPYDELSEADKDLNSEYADLVLGVLRQAGFEIEPDSEARRGR